MKKEFTTADRVFAMIGRFSVFCAVILGGCFLAGLAIEESRGRNETKDGYDLEDFDNEEDCYGNN